MKSFNILDFEDRNNDWLAAQLKSEGRLPDNTKEAEKLRKDHFGDCPAEGLAREHAESCDAGVLREATVSSVYVEKPR